VVEIFVKKFHRCYKDGINGQRDMRSCSGLYFLLRLIPYLQFLMKFILHHKFLKWTLDVIVHSTVAILIAFFKPYKKFYMNVLDMLILLNSTAICHLITSSGYRISSSKYIYTLCLLPGSVFWVCIILKLLAKVWAKTSLPVRRCFRRMCTSMQRAKIAQKGRESDDSDSESDRSNRPLLQQPSSTVTTTEVNLPSPSSTY
jgi:hypothetical protein